jgi:hypothetical protein
MANQMIALQARNPQLPDPARATTQMANMMNMARQQEAAQLQGERARQEMEYARAGESRAEETQRLNVRKENQAFRVAGMKELRNRGLGVLQSGSEEAYQLLLKQTEAIDPDSAAVMRQIAPTLGDGKALKFFITEADKFIDKNTSQRKNEIVYDKNNNPISVDSGGDTPFEATPLIVTNIRDVNQPPRATPTAPQASAMERDPSAVSAAPMTFGTDAERPLNAYQQEDLDRLETELGMKNTAASFTGMGGAAQMTPDVMSRIVDSAFNTGVMAQVDFDQLLASQPPQNKQALMDTFQRANIRLQADAPSLADSAMGQQQMPANPVQRPDASFADFRGPTPQLRTANLGGDMPMMRSTEAQYRVGDPIQGRSASPTPGIYNVNPQDVAAISQAQRPSKQELYDAEAAKIKAVRDAGPAPVTRQQKLARKTEVANAYTKTQALMDKAYNPKEGVIALASKIKALSADQKESITGYSGYIPSFRASSREADTLIGNLKGVVTGLGKDAAAASGAIGPMAVQEWKIVADMIAKLDLEGMTPRALDAQMNRIIEQVRNATNLAERVYNVQYGDDIKEYPDFKLRGAPSPRAKTPVTKTPPGVSAAEWKAMTPAERKLWQ